MAIVLAKGYSMLAALGDLLFFLLFIPLPDFLCGANVAPPSGSLLARGDSESFAVVSPRRRAQALATSLSFLRPFLSFSLFLAVHRVLLFSRIIDPLVLFIRFYVDATTCDELFLVVSRSVPFNAKLENCLANYR